MRQVLVADDHMGSCQAIKIFLENRLPGLEVLIANTLEDTLEILCDQAPDVLVIDTELQGLKSDLEVDILRSYFPKGLIIFTSTKPETARMISEEKGFRFFDKSTSAECLLKLMQIK